jgi:hypothetical protein
MPATGKVRCFSDGLKDFAAGVLDPHRYLTLNRREHLLRTTVQEGPLPTGFMCLVVYNRYLIESNAVNPQGSSNLCLECTIIQKGGEENMAYRNTLFPASAVAMYAAKKTAKVISKLSLSGGGGGANNSYESFGFPLSQASLPPPTAPMNGLQQWQQQQQQQW